MSGWKIGDAGAKVKAGGIGDGALSAPQRRFGRINDRAFVAQAGLAISRQQQRTIQIDKLRALRNQQRRRHRQRRAEHAADHDLEIQAPGFFFKFQRLGEAASLVEFDVHRIIETHESAQAGAVVHAFIRADRHAVIDVAQRRIVSRGQGLLDQADAVLARRLNILAQVGGVPAFIGVDDDSTGRSIFGNCAHAGRVIAAAQLDLQQRAVRIRRRLTAHRLRRAERQRIGRLQRLGRQPQMVGHALAGKLCLQVPQGAVNGVSRRARRHQPQQRIAPGAFGNGERHALDLLRDACKRLIVALVGHTFAPSDMVSLPDATGQNLGFGLRAAGNRECAGYRKGFRRDGKDTALHIDVFDGLAGLLEIDRT